MHSRSGDNLEETREDSESKITTCCSSSERALYLKQIWNGISALILSNSEPWVS